MNKIVRFLCLVSFLCVATPVFAQNDTTAQKTETTARKIKKEVIEMADTLRADGKIWVVVAIILIVLIGLFTYLFMLDKKVTRLENLIREREQTK
jgi:hypothetical protein